MSIPISQSIPHPASPLGIQVCVKKGVCVCVYVCVHVCLLICCYLLGIQNKFPKKIIEAP